MVAAAAAAVVVMVVVFLRPMAPEVVVMEAETEMAETAVAEAVEVVVTVRASPRLFGAARIPRRNFSSTTSCRHRCRHLSNLRRCWSLCARSRR
jgi:hypothetical protein